MSVLFASFHTDPHVDRSIIDGEVLMTMSEEDADAWKRFISVRSSPLSVSVLEGGRVLHICSGMDTDFGDIYRTVSDRIDALETLMDGNADPDSIGERFCALRSSFRELASVMGIVMDGDGQ